jgi:hypothetical protein
MDINNIDKDILLKLRELLDPNSSEQDITEAIHRAEMFNEPAKLSGPNAQEIAINIRACVYETNEKGELVAPSQILENNFYIPIKNVKHTNECIKTFMEKVISCMSHQSQELSQNE